MTEIAYKNKLVRDLAWVVQSPELMQDEPSSGLPMFNFMVDEQDLELLRKLDDSPHQLFEFMHSPVHLPTGKIFEKLLLFWFRTCEKWDCLAHSVQLQNEKITIGELDFIVKNLLTNQTIHLEVACKYYLSSKNSSNWNTWIGPNANDRLQIKMDKLVGQIKKGSSQESRAFCEAHNIRIDQSNAIVKGFFFHHFSKIASAKPPLLANKNHNTGIWCFASEMNLMKDEFHKMILLTKDNWFSGYIGPMTEVNGHQKKYIKKANLFARCVKAQGQMEYKEVNRVFVVPDNWPNY